MPTPILATKLYLPPARPNIVPRARLIGRLNAGLPHTPGFTLISAPAGFGKTTLVSEWVAECKQPVAWLSLDEGDNDPIRFLLYLIAALQTIQPALGQGLLVALQSPQPPPTESILTELLNSLTALPHNLILVLDDYHVIDAKPVGAILTFLIEHLPPQLHLVITTREDPDLPLARLRARGQLTELRAAALRFTHTEAAGFLNQVMGLHLSPEDIVALETRTEGWIAGLQLAAISMQGHQDATGFIKSFTGSHHFVMDYLVEEVLHQQPENIQKFLLQTSILDRMCGPLCEALLLAPASGQSTLEQLEHANLFIIPLDNERRWYRYHHLFADLLRQRLAASTPTSDSLINQLHLRASQWYEDHGFDLEAFQHAAASNDIDRTERIIQGNGILLHLPIVVTTVLNWFQSLPPAILDARPSLWWRYGAVLLVSGQTTGVEEKLQAAETALAANASIKADDETPNLVGQIATARATLALTRYDVPGMLIQSRRALTYLPAHNLSYRATAHWTLGFAHLMQGERVASRQAYFESIALSQAAGDVFSTILATIGLGSVQEMDNQLYQAAETYQQVVQLAGDQPQQIIHEAHLGLARVLYEWNDLARAEHHAQQSLLLARQYDKVIDRFILTEILLARLKLAQGDVNRAAAMLANTSQSARQKNFVHRLPDVAAAQALTFIRQRNLMAATDLAETYQLSLLQARLHLARRNPSAALTKLEPLRQQMEAKGWHDERLRVMVLQTLALQAQGQTDSALQLLAEVLTLTEPQGFIRTFVDEGSPMADLLTQIAAQGIRPDYVAKLLAAFDPKPPTSEAKSTSSPAQPLDEPLSQRELEVLQLIAQGLSNREISERLFLALSTVKGHNQKIFDKLQAQNRTEALIKARALGLL
jgi:LuxR family transcriptional regulator, maltose regulon positive regulatory protein